MTLAVGTVTRSGLIILSDTRQYDPGSERDQRSLLSGTLKTTILWAGEAAVAFTGNIDVAQADVRRLINSGVYPGVTELCSHFAQCTKGSENEYLLAFASMGALYKARAGSAKPAAKQAWIGDRDGFERFQSGPKISVANNHNQLTMFGPDVPDKETVSDRLTKMQGVIEDRDVPGVGDFYTLTVLREGKLGFCFVGGGFLDAESRLLDSKGNTLMRSTGENRAYRYFVWPAKDPNLSAAAYIFPDAQMAFIFSQTEDLGFADQTRTIFEIPARHFAEAIKEEIRIDFMPFEFWHQ